MISLKDVRKSYFNQTVVKDITLTIPAGKIIGLIGENGSGKSTTLKMIAGLIKPSKGLISINGQTVSRKNSALQVSYLSELDEYYSFYTVGQMISFHASQFHDVDAKKVEEMIAFLNLDVSKKIKHLSKGNRAKLKLVLTLSRNVPIILLDEPLSGLDPMARDSIIKGLLSFIDIENQTVIITTHEIDEVESILDQIIAIRDGEIIKIVDVDTLREEEQISVLDWMKKVYQ